MKRIRSHWHAVLTVTLLACFCAGPLPGALADDPKPGGTLKFIPHADLKIIDPIWTTAYISRNHGYMIYDVLFALDENLNIRPQMVDTWEVSDDALQYTFTLRDGLLWHDGQPVTSEDVVASLQRWGRKDGQGQLLMAFTDRLEALDAKTFRLTLTEPFGLVLDALAKPSSNVPFIMPARVAATPPDEQIRDTTGSGPFIFVVDEWRPGHKVVYRRNDAYVPRDEPSSFAAGGKRAYVERVEWLYLPDAATASAALQQGEVDYWEFAPPDFVPSLEGAPGINVEIADLFGAQAWLRPNHLHPPFDNKKARQALMWMVDQEAYMRAAYGAERFWKACPAFFMCDGPYGSDAGSNPLMQQDFDKAKQLLQEAGYDGRPVVLMDATDIDTNHYAALVTAQLLKKIGLNVKLQAMDWSTVVARRADRKPVQEGGWNLFHTGWIFADLFTPAVNQGVRGGCNDAWFGWYCSPAMEELRAAWAITTDEAERQSLSADIQRLAMDEVPYVPLGENVTYRAYREHVKGVLKFPAPILWNVWLDK